MKFFKENLYFSENSLKIIEGYQLDGESLFLLEESDIDKIKLTNEEKEK